MNRTKFKDFSENSLKSDYSLSEADEYNQFLDWYKNCDLIVNQCVLNAENGVSRTIGRFLFIYFNLFFCTFMLILNPFQIFD